MTMEHVVSFSGGAGSLLTAKLLVEQYGAKDVTLLFADTNMEHSDVYKANKIVTKKLGCQFIRIADGRDVWQVFSDEGYQGNTRVDPCSRVLKRELIYKWIKKNRTPADCIIYVGIDCTEEHRLPEIQKRNLPFIYDSVLVQKDIFMLPDTKKEIYDFFGLDLPELYKIGLAHNNCNGFCVKAGLGHYYKLYHARPDLYAMHEASQEKLILENPKLDKPFLRKQKDGALKYLTLKQYREQYLEANVVTVDEKLDMGSCGCTS